MRDILGDRDPAIPQHPTKVAEPSRESQLPKRFYKDVTVDNREEGWAVLLDGRPVRTPGKMLMCSPHEGIAEKLADEWQAQGERIDPMTMPYTRLANTAVDGVAQEMQAVKEDIIRYAGTDLLCYRVEQPDGLVARHTEHWDPLLDWSHAKLGARFELAAGVIHVNQPPESIAAFSTHVGMIDNSFVLAGAHVITSLTGSAIISLAVVKGELEAREAWTIAHLDEDWNIELWGRDEEAEERRAKRWVDMKAACTIIGLLR